MFFLFVYTARLAIKKTTTTPNPFHFLIGDLLVTQISLKHAQPVLESVTPSQVPVATVQRLQWKMKQNLVFLKWFLSTPTDDLFV